MVLFSRLRGGSAGAARGAKSFLTETVSRVRDAGATGQLTVRADSAFYSRAVLGTAVKLGVEFSVTARQDKKIRAAIEAIDEDAWAPIPYWLSTPEVSGADVAETSYTAFSGTDAITVRLVVRRVRPTPGQPAGAVHHLGLPRVRHQPPRRHGEVEADHPQGMPLHAAYPTSGAMAKGGRPVRPSASVAAHGLTHTEFSSDDTGDPRVSTVTFAETVAQSQFVERADGTFSLGDE